jgi:hypothetical protein
MQTKNEPKILIATPTPHHILPYQQWAARKAKAAARWARAGL